MKSIVNIVICTAFAACLATPVSAQRANQGPFTQKVYKGASSMDQIQKLKKGSLYAKVCMECKAMTVREVADDKEVAALCHEGGSIACEGCKKKFVVKRVGPPGKESITTTVAYVDSKGKDCMFIVPING